MILGSFTPREVVVLHELVEHSRTHGPVSAERYARIVGCRSELPASWERSVRRVQARLTALGYGIRVEHKGVDLVADFAVDRQLVADVESGLDLVQAKESGSEKDFFRRFGDEVEGEVDPRKPKGRRVDLPAGSIVEDRSKGLSIKALCRRYHVGERRITALLSALGVEPRKPGPMLLTDRKNEDAIRKALDGAREGYGRVTDLARALGCHRDTARAILRRLGSYGPVRPRRS